MLVALTQRDDMVVDATLRHYLARSTAAGARDEALSRLHSSAHTVRHPPLPPDDAFANALEDKRMGSSMADVPRSTLRAFMDPPRATLERAARGDVHAGVLGDSGEDELHVLLRARETRRDDGEKHEIERDACESYFAVARRDVRASARGASLARVRRRVSRSLGGIGRQRRERRRARRKQKTKSEDCVRPWSVLDARGAYDAIGLGNVVDALGALGARLATRNTRAPSNGRKERFVLLRFLSKKKVLIPLSLTHLRIPPLRAKRSSAARARLCARTRVSGFYATNAGAI
jgi:hypothetical protein